MNTASILIARPDGVIAGPMTELDLEEEIRECRFLQHQMAARARAEGEVVRALCEAIADLGGIPPESPLSVAYRCALLRRMSYEGNADAYAAVISQLESAVAQLKSAGR